MEDFSSSNHSSLSPLSVNSQSHSKQTRTVKISNLSLEASARNIRQLFSATGDVDYLEIHCDNENSQTAFVSFKDPQGAESAILLSGSTVVDLAVTITLAQDNQLPLATSPLSPARRSPRGAESAFHMAEEVVNNIIAKSYVLGKDTLNRAKSFDERHQLSSTTSFKVREMDQKLHISEKLKSAYVAAEQTVKSARYVLMKNEYVHKGASWVTVTFNRVAMVAAGDVNKQGKLGMGDDSSRRTMKDDTDQIPLSKSPKTPKGSAHNSPSKSSIDKKSD